MLQMMFLHIPKTGGSTLESILRASQVVVKQSWWKKGFPSHHSIGEHLVGHELHLTATPWHLPPDVVQDVFHHALPEGRFCIIRNPADRYESCVNDWNFRVLGVVEDGDYGKNRTDADVARALLSGRSSVVWDHELTHKQPQHWFVWASDGQVQCDCVVAFERIHVLTTKHKHSRGVAHATKTQLPESLAELYRADWLLWRLARNSPSLCYRPAALH